MMLRGTLCGLFGFLAITVSVDLSVDEFVEILALAPSAVRSRYHLPGTCDPQISATRTDPRQRRLHVRIACPGNESITPRPVKAESE